MKCSEALIKVLSWLLFKGDTVDNAEHVSNRKIILLLLLLSHFSRVRFCATPQMAARQALLSLGFSRQEHWSGLPFPSPMHESEKWKWSHSVVFDSSRPHGLQPTRLLYPWDFPGKSTGVGCHCLLRERSYNKSKRFTKVSGMHTYLWKLPNEDRNWSLVRGAMEISALFWHLETLYWMTFHHWEPGSSHCVPDRFTFILKQVFVYLFIFFAPNSHWRSQQKSSSVYPLGSSLVSHPSFCGSFLWIPSTSFLPPFFFFFFFCQKRTHFWFQVHGSHHW